MTERTYKVGDLVAWPLVPDGALVRDDRGRRRLYVRHAGHGDTVHDSRWLQRSGRAWRSWSRAWPWNISPADSVTIVALDVPADASAVDLQQLAEVFEVREALTSAPCMECGAACVCWGICEGRLETFGPMCDEHCGHGGEDGWCTMSGPKYDERMDELARRLRLLGWRKGQTREDAARLLAEDDAR
jgi:hypothetical protein